MFQDIRSDFEDQLKNMNRYRNYGISKICLIQREIIWKLLIFKLYFQCFITIKIKVKNVFCIYRNKCLLHTRKIAPAHAKIKVIF